MILEIGVVAAASVPWLVALLVVHLVRKPTRPVAGPPTIELGPEPPALANFLVNDFRPTRDAVPATLLDLAARGFVEFEHRGPEAYVCRVKTRAPAEPLTEYERRVLEHLRRRASGGIVPAEALTTGPDEESKRWWNGFRGEVIADSKRRGLSRDILDLRVFAALAAAAAVPALLSRLLFDSEVAYLYAAGALGLMYVVRMRHPQEDTPAGLDAASRWLGVRAKLAEDEAFGSQSPIAVALWDRHLAYGAALGVAEGTVHRIPMGAESDRDAWSSYGGRWRPVRVKYGALSPGWGESPLETALVALIPAAISTCVLWILEPLLLDLWDEVPRVGQAILATIMLIPALVVLGAAIVIVRAVADLASTREVTGQIVRLRSFGSRRGTRKQGYFVAVDDGLARTIRAWRVRPELLAGLSQYDVVTMSVTPRLGYVRSITRLDRASDSPPGEPSVAQMGRSAY